MVRKSFAIKLLLQVFCNNSVAARLGRGTALAVKGAIKDSERIITRVFVGRCLSRPLLAHSDGFAEVGRIDLLFLFLPLFVPFVRRIGDTVSTGSLRQIQRSVGFTQ